jgi:Na+/H+ antiporter NhaD/arsenite permease-like protein
LNTEARPLYHARHVHLARRQPTRPVAGKESPLSPVIVVFALVYLGMMFGRFPGLALDRTGVALLGAVVLIASGLVAPEDAWRAVDVPTIGLLFGLMVVSAQFRLGGLYGAVSRWVAGVPAAPPTLLALLLAVVAGLSALLTNDIICLAMTPVLAEGCVRRRLNPLPYLLGLACAANVGSAATLIGNPQNMLIGQTLGLSFAGYFASALPVVLASLAVIWGVLCLVYRRDWHAAMACAPVESQPVSRWQSTKGTVVLFAAVLAFLFTPLPRDVVALACAGLLLVSRKMHSRNMLGLVDWQLLVLFIGLFVVNHAFAACGALEGAFDAIRRTGIDLTNPGWLFVVTALLSNLVSNVPATMLLLPAAHYPGGGLILALSSTLAGNLIVVGSIANIIVIEQARACGIPISWREHARVGLPAALITLALAGAWIALIH